MMVFKRCHRMTFCLLFVALTACGTLDAGVESNLSTPVPAISTADETLPTAVPAQETTTPIPLTTTLLATTTAVSATTTTSPPVRMEFASGAISGTQTGTLQPFGNQEYLLYALAGQTMHIALTTINGQANFSLQGVDDGQPYKRVENEDRFWDGTLPASQDYLIQVRTPDAADSYTLSITIEPLQTEPQRIQFAPGAISASFSGVIEANTNNQYVLAAQAGQTLHVSLTTTNGQANFDLVGVSDGTPYKRAIYLPAAWDGLLPLTQDYLINVSVPANTTDSYTLFVTVDPLPVPETASERIEFPVGGITASVNGSFAAGGDGRSFILAAAEGQTMTIQVTSNAVGAIGIFVKDSTGRIILSGTDEHPLSLNLPDSGDYTISLYTPGAAPSVNYALTVTIQPLP